VHREHGFDWADRVTGQQNVTIARLSVKEGYPDVMERSPFSIQPMLEWITPGSVSPAQNAEKVGV
jgi:hypothetical protein